MTFILVKSRERYKSVFFRGACTLCRCTICVLEFVLSAVLADMSKLEEGGRPPAKLRSPVRSCEASRLLLWLATAKLVLGLPMMGEWALMP